ncbi:MAG: B12 binding domain/radical SAM domain fusion protein [bacterium]|nr:MAG: B12 binding domain/radical SAM domain fusion protein [bacterium]
MSKLLLINPWSRDEEGVVWSFAYQKDYWRNPYKGLVQLATYLRKNGHTVKILDCERDLLIEAGGNPDLMLKLIESKVRYLHPDVVGVTAMTYRWMEAYKILNVLTELKPELRFRLILGGRHASSETEMCMKDIPGLDCIFHGFAEVGLNKYLDGDPLEEIPGAAFMSQGEVKRTPNEVVNDLDELPWPDWSLIDSSFYTHPNIRVHRSTGTPLRSLDTICSRGCNMACAFCSGADGKPKWHSVNYILDYIEWTQKTYQTNATIFQDSSLGNNKTFLVKLCEGLIRRNINKKLIWTCNMRADQVDTETVGLMYRAGCRLIFIGFESGSERILNLMHKGCTVEDNIRCAQVLEDAEMPYWASFILGYPGETEQDIYETGKFIEKINPTTGWVNAFFPSPGSNIYKKLKREGRITVSSIYDWINYGRTGEGNSNLGLYAEIPSERFRYCLFKLQGYFQKITDTGIKRELEFSK